MNENQQLVEKAFNKWKLGQGSIVDLMDDDAMIVIPGTAAHCGTFRKQQFLSDIAAPFMRRFSEPPVPDPTLMLSGGDNVVVVANAEGTMLDGRLYRNDYVFVLEFREGRLAKATEFLDMNAFNIVWDSVNLATRTTERVESSR